MIRLKQRIPGIALALFFFTSGARGVDTSFWEIATYENYLEGTLENISLAREGQIRLAPECKDIFDPEETLVLSLAQDSKGRIYFGTGHQGKVFRINRKGEGKLFFTAEESDVFALTVGPDRALYVGSSPEGKVYRVTAEGASSVYFDPKSKYIWALAFDAGGRLYVGTGDRGKIYRVTGPQEGQVFFDSEQTHVISMVFDPNGNLLAGSDPNGLIYRVSPAGKGFVLYKSDLPEIHALALDEKGHIYAAALGSARRGAFFVRQTLTTNTAGSRGNRTGVNPPADQPPPAPGSSQQGQRPGVSGRVRPPVSLAPVGGKGRLYRILPDYTVETLWRSERESIFGLVAHAGRVLFSTGTKGRIFQLDAPVGRSPELVLLSETHQALATRLIPGLGGEVFVATGNIGKIFHLSDQTAAEGTYLSPVRDTKFISKWGRIGWQGQAPTGSEVELYVRAGNSEHPNATWSDWTVPDRNREGEAIRNHPARYLQWKAILRGGKGGSPLLDGVRVSFLNQNVAPEISSLNVATPGARFTLRSGGRSSGRGGRGGSSRSTVSTATVTTSGRGVRGNGTKSPVTISWQAKDPNGDSLIYDLYLRAAGEKSWLLVEENLERSSFQLIPTSISDGEYTAKVVASDREANPTGLDRETERLSAPFRVDNTPPKVTAERLEGKKGGVRFTVEDAVSSLRTAEVRIDSEPWKPLASEDGIVDARREVFVLPLPGLPAGEHRISIRVHDLAGNVGLAKIVIHTSG